MTPSKEEIEAKIEALIGRLPEGYQIATVGRYPREMKDQKTGKPYTLSIQLANQATFDIARGVGITLEEAFEHALSNIGGDDGLSAMFRDKLQGTKH